MEKKLEIITKDRHNIIPHKIDENVLSVIHKLRESGFQAYLVGGCVRDLLRGLCPKDFDVATDAVPKQIKQVFGYPACRLIGRRFRIAHIYGGRNRKAIEVATFRAADDVGERKQNMFGMTIRDNVYGTINEDAYRRDFTINSLYYDPIEEKILDFTCGFEDLKSNTLRVIGSAAGRYREDPVRMLRAARFIGKLNLQPTQETSKEIARHKMLLRNISSARLYDEAMKAFLYGYAEKNFQSLRQYGLFRLLFPSVFDQLKKKKKNERFLYHVFQKSDERVHQHKKVIPSFMLAAILWPSFIDAFKKAKERNMSSVAEKIFAAQMRQTSMPIRVREDIKKIWSLQILLEKKIPRSVSRLKNHPRFRAAFDFLELRAEVFSHLDDVVKFWQGICAK